MENSIEEDITLIEKSLCDKDTIIQYHYWVGTDFLNAVERIVADYKRVLKENEELKEDRDKFKKALNSYLPNDIYINKVLKVPDDFHARYMALEKTYEYNINMGLYNPLTRGFIYQYGKKLNIALIDDALKYFKGKHDFTTFVSAEDKRSDKRGF